MAVSSASSNDLDNSASLANCPLVRHGPIGDLLLLPIMLGLHPSLDSMYSTMHEVVFGFLSETDLASSCSNVWLVEVTPVNTVTVLTLQLLLGNLNYQLTGLLRTAAFPYRGIATWSS